MGIIGDDGMIYSFDSTELIEDLERDIFEFGDNLVWALFEFHSGAKIYKNYLLVADEKPTEEELTGLKADKILASKLLQYLKKQNEL